VRSDARRWAGIDVGGRRKGFDCAAVDRYGLVKGPANLKEVDEVLQWLISVDPRVVALDSPRTAAPDGETSREGERSLARAVCGIRWTPDRARLRTNRYYEWVRHGFELYDAVTKASHETGWTVIEAFPTASWTRWAGRRGNSSRAIWTRQALESLALTGLPSKRLNQDERDAIAAALTARLYEERRCEAFGEIVVPTERPVSPGS
jgi:predicted nuclease with RNAse H fold